MSFSGGPQYVPLLVLTFVFIFIELSSVHHTMNIFINLISLDVYTFLGDFNHLVT